MPNFKILKSIVKLSWDLNSIKNFSSCSSLEIWKFSFFCFKISVRIMIFWQNENTSKWKLSRELRNINLTLRRPNFIGAHVPVAPDLAQMVRVGSDHSKKLTSVFYGAKNEKLTFKTIYIHIKFYKINFFFLIFFCVIFYLWCVTSRNDESLSFRFHNRLLI